MTEPSTPQSGLSEPLLAEAQGQGGEEEAQAPHVDWVWFGPQTFTGKAITKGEELVKIGKASELHLDLPFTVVARACPLLEGHELPRANSCPLLEGDELPRANSCPLPQGDRPVGYLTYSKCHYLWMHGKGDGGLYFMFLLTDGVSQWSCNVTVAKERLPSAGGAEYLNVCGLYRAQPLSERAIQLCVTAKGGEVIGRAEADLSKAVLYALPHSWPIIAHPTIGKKNATEHTSEVRLRMESVHIWCTAMLKEEQLSESVHPTQAFVLKRGVSRAKSFAESLGNTAMRGMGNLVESVFPRLDDYFRRLLMPVLISVALYYADVVLELNSVIQFLRAGLYASALAILFILFSSPAVSYSILKANDLAERNEFWLYMCHAAMLLKLRAYQNKFIKSQDLKIQATKRRTAYPVKEITKSPVFEWAILGHAISASSLTLLLKIYTVFANSAGSDSLTVFQLGSSFFSINFSCLSLSKTIATLANYGKPMALSTLAKEGVPLFAEINSRVFSLALVGVAYVDLLGNALVPALLLADFAVELAVLLLGPPRELRRNGMSRTALLFWATLMVFCAPPKFIPQFGDTHPIYYTFRVLQLCALFWATARRCGQQGSPMAYRECHLLSPHASSADIFIRASVVVGMLSSVVLAGHWLAVVFSAAKRRWLVWKLQRSRLQQRGPAEGVQVTYGAEFFLRMCSMPNRYLAIEGTESRAPVVCRPLSTAVLRNNSPASIYKPRKFTFEAAAEEGGARGAVCFGDIVRVRLVSREGTFITGGRRGFNKFVEACEEGPDAKDWKLEHHIKEHYTWRVCAIPAGARPNPLFRRGDELTHQDRFALQLIHLPAGQDRLEQGTDRVFLFLTAGRGPTTDLDKASVWTTPLDWIAFEDSPVEGKWPSFEFVAEQALDVDGSDMAKLAEDLHFEDQTRGAAFAKAAQSLDVTMMEFMMESGCPVNVADGSYMTPLHHWVFREDEDEGEDQNSQLRLFKAIVKKSHHLNFYDRMFYTPLHYAALLGKRKFCEILLDGGADINAGDWDAWTPLHDAVRYQHKDMAAFLLGRRADPEACTHSGFTALAVAGFDTAEELRKWAEEDGGPWDQQGDLTTRFSSPEAALTRFPDQSGICEMDKQKLLGKILVLVDDYNSFCISCSRFGVDDGFSSNIAPWFRCNTCSNPGPIPYLDADWDIYWACHRGCYTFRRMARMEPGARQKNDDTAELFSDADTNDDGEVNRKEFKAFFHSELDSSTQVRMGDADALFDKIDVNQNGVISKHEFRAWLSSLQD